MAQSAQNKKNCPSVALSNELQFHSVRRGTMELESSFDFKHWRLGGSTVVTSHLYGYSGLAARRLNEKYSAAHER